VIKEFKRAILEVKGSIDRAYPCYPLYARVEDASGTLIMTRAFMSPCLNRKAEYEFEATSWKFPVTVTIEDQEGIEVSQEVYEPLRQLTFEEMFQ
jgi:hypothetical protein